MYRSVLISRGWDKGVPLYAEVYSFQGVGIEEGVPMYTEFLLCSIGSLLLMDKCHLIISSEYYNIK